MEKLANVVPELNLDGDELEEHGVRLTESPRALIIAKDKLTLPFDLLFR
jgi:hypothetical protein